MSFPISQQVNAVSCVAACAVSALEYLGGIPPDQARLHEELIKVDSKGDGQFGQLSAVLPKMSLGWSLHLAKVSDRSTFSSQLSRLLREQNHALAAIQRPDRSLHCIAITDVQRGVAVVWDPDGAAQHAVAINTLEAQWTKAIAALIPPGPPVPAGYVIREIDVSTKTLADLEKETGISPVDLGYPCPPCLGAFYGEGHLAGVLWGADSGTSGLHLAVAPAHQGKRLGPALLGQYLRRYGSVIDGIVAETSEPGRHNGVEEVLRRFGFEKRTSAEWHLGTPRCF